MKGAPKEPRTALRESLIDAEMSACGAAILLSGRPAEQRTFAAQLRPEMFSHGPCALIWQAIQAITTAGGVADALTIKYHTQKLVSDEDLIEAMEATPSTANAYHYAEIVRSHYTRRTVGGRAHDLANRAKDLDVPIADIMEEAGRIAAGTLLGSQATTDIADIVLKDSPRGLPTGFHEIDRRSIMRGLPMGQLTVIGANTGVGKSALCQQLAAKYAEDLHVAYATFSDLTPELLKWRWVKQGTGFMSLENRTLEELDIIDGYIKNHLDMLGLKVYDGTVHGSDVGTFARWLESLHATWRVDAWVVDYVQIMTDSECRDSNAEKQCMAVSKKLAPLASRIGGVGIVASQVDTSGEGYRYSQQLKMDAGFGLIIKRDPDGLSASCRVIKNRFGSCGEFTLAWDQPYARFAP